MSVNTGRPPLLKFSCSKNGEIIDILADDCMFFPNRHQTMVPQEIMTVSTMARYYSFINDVVTNGFAFCSDVLLERCDGEKWTFSLFGVLKEEIIYLIAVQFPTHILAVFEDFTKMINEQGRLLRQEQKKAFPGQGSNWKTIDIYAKLNNDLLKTQRSLEKKQHQLEQAYKEIEALSKTDALTGIGNRLFFIESAKKELYRCSRYGMDACILYMDIDHFKRINDSYGHVAGDATLSHFARVCRAQLRETDIFGRIGGEEFCVLLPHTPMNEALSTAERIRMSVESATLAWEGQTIVVTVSIGVALFQDEKEFSELLNRADRALYNAKKQGRNRIEIE
jgi:diguanylate cyclase (GGDEF)-like protein